MKLTKYGHACFTVEHNNGQLLVVDPGAWSPDFVVTENIVAVFISHEHPDHFDQQYIAAIFDKNPNCLIISNQNVTNLIKNGATKTVSAGDRLNVGSFALEFFGGQHASITSSIPVIPNLGIMINNLIYYPGDSYILPEKPVDTLALPIAAPWLKFSESADFLTQIHPRYAFPTHDAVLSDIGTSLLDRMASGSAEQLGIIYERINGKTIDL